MKAKKMFNTVSREPHNQARVINGNPDGIINLAGSNHQWAVTIYKNMKKRTWFVGQVSLVNDITNYHKMPAAYLRAYDLILAQLITNDSIQLNQLMDGFNRYVTSPVINLCLSVQSAEEGLHAESYSTMAEDIAKDTDRIFQMQHHDPELARKNKAVEAMYDSVYGGDGEPSDEDMLVAAGANQILEELVFPGGFAGMLLLRDFMPGSAELIREIMKDETLSHVPLFKGIFRNIVLEEFDGVVPQIVVDKITQMVKAMTEAEIRWSVYALEGVMGVSEQAIRILVETQANSVCANLKLPFIYEKHNNSPLNSLLANNLKGGELASKTNFFTNNVAEYSKSSVVVDF